MFSFRFERILEIREQIVKDSTLHLSQLIMKRDKLNRLLEKEREGYFQDRDLWTNAIRKNRVQEQPILDLAIEKRKQRIMEILSAIQEVKEDIELAELTVREANKNLKAIEIIKEKELQKYLQKEKREESKKMDEHGIKSFVEQLQNRKG